MLVKMTKGYEKTKTHKCTKCEYAATKLSVLNIHVRLVHDKIKHYTCAECGREFSQKLILERHVAGVHNKKWGHKCKECGKVFSQKAHLLVHGRVHVEALHENIKSHFCD